MRFFPIAATLTFGVCVGCASRHGDSSGPPTLTWKKTDFLAKTFVLDHPTEIEELSFDRPSRMVSVTFGYKIDDYSKVMAPLFYWKLKKNRLVIYDRDRKVQRSLELLERKNGYLKARRDDGSLVIYTVR